VFNSFFNPIGILQDNHPLMKPVSIPNFGTPPSSSSASSSSSLSSFLSAWILAAVVLVVVVGLGLVVYLRKRQ
jgi:hypothetical protein